jgi:DNA gyrase/topoisomerase IV subunit A
MKPASSPYIKEQRKQYAIYVLQSRAIPSVTDGLKAGGRRALWTARDGHKWKSANLAGATMPIHPHASPEGAINTLAAPYGNNHPFFKGDGAFGTLIDPTAYGASRYTAVTVSAFTEDVLFRDIEIIPMVENYDGTLMEPAHFLPLVPAVLLNPAEGVAVGFATNILPRALDDIIAAQIAHLKKAKAVELPLPRFLPLDNAAHTTEETKGGIAYYFSGSFERHDASTLTITKLPYGQTHVKVTSKIEDLIENGIVVDSTDDSRDTIKIKVKFTRGFLKDKTDADVCKLLGITVRHIENLNVLDFTGKAVWNTTPIDIIHKFTDWRLEFYVKRYERLRDLLAIDLQRYYDIKTAIANNVGGIARKIQSRSELKEFLTEIEIVHIDYIADLPVYRFTEEERLKNEKHIVEAEATMKEYQEMLSSENSRRTIYIEELKEILSNYKKGKYSQ